MWSNLMKRHAVSLETFLLVVALSLSILPIHTIVEMSKSKSLRSSGVIQYKPPDLGNIAIYGINLAYWQEWTLEEIDRELTDIGSRGFNFVRISIYFHRFIDWQAMEFIPSRNQAYYEKIIYFMSKAAENGLLVEAAPMEPWKFGDDMPWWWTNSTFQERISFFYETYSRWVRDMGWWKIIPYITLWWEATYYMEWVDGYYVVLHGLQNYAETNKDWKDWLSQHGVTPTNLTFDNMGMYLDQYISWSRDRFNLITQLKANAVKKGWPSAHVGGEIGYKESRAGTGPAYHASKYLQLSAKFYVDVLNPHDYFDSTSWSLEPYLNATAGRIVIANEIGPALYAGIDANNATAWWNNMRPKMELLANNGTGFVIWNWMDYDARAYGLKDINFNPRPILQFVTEWIANRTIT